MNVKYCSNIPPIPLCYPSNLCWVVLFFFHQQRNLVSQFYSDYHDASCDQHMICSFSLLLIGGAQLDLCTQQLLCIHNHFFSFSVYSVYQRLLTPLLCLSLFHFFHLSLESYTRGFISRVSWFKRFMVNRSWLSLSLQLSHYSRIR